MSSGRRSNTQRVFDELVSIEAWSSRTNDHAAPVTVHADVVFRNGRLGQEAESPVRFQVRLRRAEVVFILQPSEPLKIIQSSVARDKSAVSGQHTTEIDTTKNSSYGAGAYVDGASAAGLTVAAATNKGRRTSTRLLLEERVGLFVTTQSKTPEGSYRWEISSIKPEGLIGKVWDPISEPRLAMRDTRANEKDIEGACSFEIRCKKEDIKIDDIVLKDESLLKRFAKGEYFHNKRAAAEAFIRSSLVRRGLGYNDFGDPFGDIVIANIMVDPEVK